MKPAINVTLLNDEDLVQLAGHNQDAVAELLARYKPLVRSRSRKLFLPGADHEDLLQEGMIGLFKAISAYDHASAVPFRAFADRCVKSQLHDAIRQANRDKHRPLNSSLSLDMELTDSEDTGEKLLELIADPSSTPEEIVLNQEELETLNKYLIAELSDFENQVLAYFLQGLSYLDISEQLSVTTRSVDGALQRLRRKIRQYRER